jgi:phosphoglycolate phosphatase-like HAD superfamily hydrolase
MNKIIAVDFGGTLVLPFVPEKANLERFKILGIKIPTQKVHKKMHATKSHYDVLRTKFDKEFGVKDKMQMLYTENRGKQIKLNGKEIKTAMLTDLFRICMYKVANNYKLKIFDKDFVSSLKKLQRKGYKLAVVSGIRSDIITGILQISGSDLKFDHVYGQDPILSYDDNDKQFRDLSKKGKIKFIIGDKLDDFKLAKKLKAKTIFVTWGHPMGGEEKFSDYTINKGKQLLNIIK